MEAIAEPVIASAGFFLLRGAFFRGSTLRTYRRYDCYGEPYYFGKVDRCDEEL